MNKDTKRLFLSAPHVGEDERKLLLDAYDSNWIAPLGPHVTGFEVELAEICNRRHCAALISGTAAIHLALDLLGCEREDYVMVQSFTFCGTVNPVKYCNAEPYFIDSERDTWNMCPDSLEAAIKKLQAAGKRVRAIIPVHLYGMPAKIDKILEIAGQYNIPVIEDAAEALGSSFGGKPCGSFGEFSILSFNGNKIITTSGGGALLSNDEKLISRARYLSTQARDDAPHYEHTEIGYNYRLSNLCAAIGRGQLQSLSEKVEKRQAIHGLYRQFFQKFPFIKFQEAPNDQYVSNRWLTCITIDKDKLNEISPEDIRLQLDKDNIESRPLWKPMHIQPVFQGCECELTGVSEDLFRRGLCLPSGSGMDISDLDRVLESLSKIFQ